MSRISSIFFLIALAVYYLPKFLNVKKTIYLKVHIVSGILSAAFMVGAFIEGILLKDGIIKYLGFTIIMLLIIGTGYFIKKNSKLGRVLHIVSTVSFFIYLFLIIKVF